MKMTNKETKKIIFVKESNKNSEMSISTQKCKNNNCIEIKNGNKLIEAFDTLVSVSLANIKEEK